MELHDPFESISTVRRRWTARILLMIGLAGPAFLLVFYSRFWLETFAFANAALPRQMQLILGVLALAGSLMIPFPKVREFGYLSGVVFFGLLAIMSLTSAIFLGVLSEFVFIFPLLLFLYLEGTMVTVRNKVRLRETPERGIDDATSPPSGGGDDS